MQKILVPTDFSATATKALTYAAEIAKRTGGSIYLMHTDILESPVVEEGQAAALHEKYLSEITQSYQSDLDAAKKSVNIIYPAICIETFLVKGKTIQAVLEFTDEHKVDMIVMGTAGATGLKEVFIGSVAAGVIGRSRIPVLAIPTDYEMEEPDGLLFATNHFEEDRELLLPIVNLANIFRAIIHVTVFVDTDDAKPEEYADNSDKLTDYLAYLNASFPGTQFKGELLAGSKFEETIELYDEKNELDIIAMISYPKNLFERIIGKNLTKKMAYHSKIPLLAIPAK